ncbi:RsmB/NOP family class I SAM-dependent RNA methyltransferase [Paenibacillus caui]|uniref:RsmB/NOP family class I SAM-dependent RNA methyltransferase n=1 Tax=Paenibacillus caui TaxID=2873927 RepID=UPI001CAA1B6D|nr:RsmB/NOP family class I SAM-dependent RNA methyltransferase [Paenibacillus caui]
MPSVTLPPAFRSEMISMLGEREGEQFLASYQKERLYGLRINTLKIGPLSKMRDNIKDLFRLQPVPWCPDGYYYSREQRPGRHPYHAAGLYYIQEPSAMSAVELLDPRPGETVLDLAAAPGGKTTQIAAKMQGQGMLVTNEIHPARAKILAENVERMGIQNAIVTQASPGELASRFPLVFDCIMLDAPCSGEGMFRKDEKAASEWSPSAPSLCAARQRDILHDAVAMLKPGGRLAYSTCTFNRSENEENMQWLLEQYSFMVLEEERRIWPHLEAGEGHYVALLRRKPEDEETGLKGIKTNRKKDKGSGNSRQKGNESASAKASCLTWMNENIPDFPFEPDRLITFGEALYLLPQSSGLTVTLQKLDCLKIPRAGLRLGSFRKGRFEPDHALAIALTADQSGSRINLSADSPELSAYLRGETLVSPADQRGWTLVTVDGYPLGWGKCSNGQLKNHLPKGLRQTAF